MNHDPARLRDLTIEFATTGDSVALRRLLDATIGTAERHAAQVPAVAGALDQARALSSILEQFENTEQTTAQLMAELAAAEAAGDADLCADLGGRIQKLWQNGMVTADALIPEQYRPETLTPPYPALRDALDDNDAEALEAVLATGIDLNGFTDRYGTPPLSWALLAPNRSLRRTGQMIGAGADAAYATEEGYTALHVIGDYTWGGDDCTVEELTQIVGVLVAHGADIEARTHWGWTPLYRAVFEGNARETEALLRNGADPNAVPVDVGAPGLAVTRTMLCAAGDSPDKVRLLLDHGADPRVSRAAMEGDAVQAEALLAEQRARGEVEDWVQELADGYRLSLELVRQANGGS